MKAISSINCFELIINLFEHLVIILIELVRIKFDLLVVEIDDAEENHVCVLRHITLLEHSLSPAEYLDLHFLEAVLLLLLRVQLELSFEARELLHEFRNFCHILIHKPLNIQKLRYLHN